MLVAGPTLRDTPLVAGFCTTQSPAHGRDGDRQRTWELEIDRSLLHGHVTAALGMIRRIALDRLFSSTSKDAAKPNTGRGDIPTQFRTGVILLS
jgi:hypothetical protein